MLHPWLQSDDSCNNINTSSYNTTVEQNKEHKNNIKKMIKILFEFMLLGLAGGLLGIFYRNCLKPKDIIFHKLYSKVFKLWVKQSREEDATTFEKFLGWVAYPLGFCIYCSTTWITIFICLLYLSSWESLPKWQDIILGVVLALGVQHLIVASACRWLINNHPDLDTSYNDVTKPQEAQ